MFFVQRDLATLVSLLVLLATLPFWGMVMGLA